eukprot:2555202-Alexandrium_andersonii.AAC.1
MLRSPSPVNRRWRSRRRGRGKAAVQLSRVRENAACSSAAPRPERVDTCSLATMRAVSRACSKRQQATAMMPNHQWPAGAAPAAEGLQPVEDTRSLANCEPLSSDGGKVPAEGSHGALAPERPVAAPAAEVLQGRGGPATSRASPARRSRGEAAPASRWESVSGPRQPGLCREEAGNRPAAGQPTAYQPRYAE